MAVLVFVVGLAAAAAQTERPRRAPEAEALVDEARRVAPEFSADIFLQVAESRTGADRKWKRNLIEEAFQTAGHAQWPYRRKGGVHTDTRPSREAWENRLDALALRTRAVLATLPLGAPTR